MKYQVSFNLDFRRNPYPGKLIVLEGIDGCGKTTQTELVSKRLEKLSKNVLTTKEPTREDEIGRLIHEVLQGKVKIPPAAIQYLYAADRVVHLEQVVLPALKEVKTVISDRYFWSSVAYGLADLPAQADLDSVTDKDRLLVVQSMLSFYHQFIVPDFTFYLRVAPSTANGRLAQLGRPRELYEKDSKLEKITQGYEWLVSQFPKEITVVDGEKSVEEVTEEIVSQLDQLV